ncbi:hypothetical protein OGAPHI_001271 [Ogataea philodendri]|uniref:54S ribosomal protein L40, mitochondrial n=1 Tax=Ogataea philodendri TaxID=1378263 RepID=A0A9P8PFM6_9ASCO|nr:uncharacterized protein OGAPHI_001271 [Ogataea philodendri]KAH3670755.1 hypothetical protein OGAPHI_001271 [Ogataea philodendri]
MSSRYSPLERLPAHLRNFLIKRSEQAQLPAFRRQTDRFVPEEKRFSKPEQWKVLEGDRVMFIKGVNKGKIARVLGLQSFSNHIFTDISETKPMVVPKQLWQENQDTYLIDYPKTVPVEDVRVVATVAREDGTEYDIAAEDVVFKGKYFDEDYKKMMPIRRVKYHEHIIIPWPRVDPVDDCAFSTPPDVVEERTHVENSILTYDQPSDFSIESLRDPTMKRAYKWNKQVLKKGDITKLTPPSEIFSETKKAMFEERKQIREAQIKEISPEVLEFIGSRVAEHLNNVTDPRFKQYVDKVSGESRARKLEAKQQEKQFQDLKIKEAEQRNKQKKTPKH